MEGGVTYGIVFLDKSEESKQIVNKLLRTWGEFLKQLEGRDIKDMANPIELRNVGGDIFIKIKRSSKVAEVWHKDKLLARIYLISSSV